jgi:hypothetical protein
MEGDMGTRIARVVAVVAVVVLGVTGAGVAVANQGDALLLGLTTNTAQGFDTKLSASSGKFALWVNQTGKGVGLKGSTASNGGAGVVGRTANGNSYGVDAVNAGAGGTGLHASGRGLAAALDGNVAVHGTCEGCLGRPGFSLAPADASSTMPDPGDDTGQYVSATIGSDGLPLISYQDATTKTLNVAHCRDAACTSATVTPVLHQLNGTAGFDTSVTVGADGLGLVSSIAVRQNPSLNFLNVTHCQNLACTSSTTTLVDQLVGNGTSIMIGYDGLGLISYQTLGSPQKLKFAHCSNVACTQSTVALADNGGLPNGDDVGAGSSLILSPYDITQPAAVMVTFLDTTTHAVWEVRCKNATCSQLSDINQLVTGADSASITIGDDGRALIAVGSSSQEIRFLHCRFVNSCSQFDNNPVPVLFAGGAQMVSLSVDSEGHPILVGSLPGVSVTTIRCLDVACGTLGSFAVLHGESSPVVALTMGADGLPLVAFYDTTLHQLVVGHCSNVFCVPYFRRR